LYSCSNDNETIDTEQTENKTLSSRPSVDVIKQYYGSDLQVIKSEKVYDAYGSYVLTKYLYPVNNFTDVYSLTDAKGEIEYLIELNRRTEKIKSTDVFTSEVFLIENLNEIPELRRAKFDLIDASIEIRASFPVFDGKKFWGWTCEKSEVLDNFTGDVSCNLDCVYNVMRTQTGKTGSFGCDDEGAKSYKVVKHDFTTIN